MISPPFWAGFVKPEAKGVSCAAYGDRNLAQWACTQSAFSAGADGWGWKFCVSGMCRMCQAECFRSSLGLSRLKGEKAVPSDIRLCLVSYHRINGYGNRLYRWWKAGRGILQITFTYINKKRIINVTIGCIDRMGQGGFSCWIILYLYHKKNKSIACFEWL